MTAAGEPLLEQALTFAVKDRASLASGLLASRDSDGIDDTEVNHLWTTETKHRAHTHGTISFLESWKQ